MSSSVTFVSVAVAAIIDGVLRFLIDESILIELAKPYNFRFIALQAGE